MEEHTLKNANNCLNTNIYSYLETSTGRSSNLYLNVVHFFNTMLIRHLCKLKTVVFLHWCLIRAMLLWATDKLSSFLRPFCSELFIRTATIRMPSHIIILTSQVAKWYILTEISGSISLQTRFHRNKCWPVFMFLYFWHPFIFIHWVQSHFINLPFCQSTKMIFHPGKVVKLVEALEVRMGSDEWSSLWRITTFGKQSFGAQSFGMQSFGAQSLGVQSFGAQSFGTQSFGAQSFGAQSLGMQSFGAHSVALTQPLSWTHSTSY